MAIENTNGNTYKAEEQQQPPPHQENHHTPGPQPSDRNEVRKILALQKDIFNIMDEVESFSGSKNDLPYKMLQEKLTRMQSHKIDAIKYEGNDKLRYVRRHMNLCINKCSEMLKLKASDEEGSQQADQNGEDEEIEHKQQSEENHGQVEYMHVDDNDKADSSMEVDTHGYLNTAV